MLRPILAALILGTLSFSASAVSVSPGTCGVTLTCWTTDDSSNLTETEIKSLVGTISDLTLFYRQDFNGAESGSFADSFETVFLNSPEPDGANISYTGGTSIDCPECYLIVKDFNQTPAQYLFDLAAWNGTEILALTEFWPGAENGAISNVAIWGGPAVVPVPAAVWLFGTALVGFIGFSRRTKV